MCRKIVCSVVLALLTVLTVACGQSGSVTPTSPTESPVSTETTLVVSPADGGQINVSGTGTSLDDKVKVIIPPGAIQGQSPVTLAVSVVQNPVPANTIPVGTSDSLLTAVGATVRIEPSTPVTFAKPITVTVPFDQSLVPAGFDPQRLIALVGSTGTTGVQSWELIKDVKVDASAGLLTFQLTHLSDATALAQEGMTDLAKEAVFQAFAEVGGEVASSIDSFALDPLITYFTTPQDKALDATVMKVMEGIRDATFPALGLSIKAGKFIIGGAEYTVEQMYAAGDIQQREALIFGGSPDRLLGVINNPYANVSFFSIKSVKDVQGITKENIGQKIKTEARLKELWGYYKSEVGTVLGQDAIDNAWPSMLEYWRGMRAAVIVDELNAKLMAKAEQIAQKLRERQQALASPTPTPTTKPASSAVSWKLVDAKIDPTAPATIRYDTWALSKNSVTEVFNSPNGTAKMQLALTWVSPPDTLVAGQSFSMAINGSGTVVNRMSILGNPIEAKFEAGQGLDVVEDTPTGWGDMTPGPSDANYAWVNFFGARVDSDALAVGGINRSYKFKVSEWYSASDIKLTLRVGGRGGDDFNGTVIFHWQKQ